MWQVLTPGPVTTSLGAPKGKGHYPGPLLCSSHVADSLRTSQVTLGCLFPDSGPLVLTTPRCCGAGSLTTRVAEGFLRHASTCAGAEAAGRTRPEPWARLGHGDLAASLPACPLRSFWQWVLLAVRMPCYLGKLGRKSCFQVSPPPPHHVLPRCLTGSAVTPCLPAKHGLERCDWIMGPHTHGCLYSERSRHMKKEGSGPSPHC